MAVSCDLRSFMALGASTGVPSVAYGTMGSTS